MAINYKTLLDKRLLALFKEARKNGGVPKEMIEELSRRFINFNPQTLRFASYRSNGAEAKKSEKRIAKLTESKTQKAGTGWKYINDEQLRELYKIKCSNGTASNELVAEVMRRLGKNAIIQHTQPEANITTVKSGNKKRKITRPISTLSDSYIIKLYTNQSKSGDIDPEIAAEFEKRFRTQERKTKRPLDSFCDGWIRKLYNTQSKRGEIDPEIAAEFEKRFRSKEKRPVDSLCDGYLRQIYYRQSKRGKIDPEIAAEFEKRFRGKERKNKRPISTFSDAYIRKLYAKQSERGEIDPDIAAEFEKRFPNNELRSQRPISTFSDVYIRKLYKEQSERGEIDPEIAAEFEKRFRNQERKTKRPISSFCDVYIRKLYKEQSKRGDIDPEIAAEFEKRFSGKERKVTRPEMPIWSYSNSYVRKKFLQQQATGTVDPDVAAEFEKRFCSPKKPRGKNYAKASDASLRTMLWRAHEEGYFPPELNDELLRRFPNYDPETKTLIGNEDKQIPSDKVNVAPKPIEIPNDQKLVVTTEQSMDGDQFYTDIFINGQKILEKHLNTEIETFLDGRLMGVRGIATQETAYPQKPMWYLFPQVSGFTEFTKMEKYMNEYVYVQKILQLPNGDLRIILNNKAQIIMDAQKIQRVGKNQIFSIISEKQK